jgi:choline dehydrogenase-like flavoprotein
MEQYSSSATGPLTEIPSSICYLPLNSVMPPLTFSHIIAAVPKPAGSSDRCSTLRHQMLTKQFEPGARLGQVEFNFDTSNYSPYFITEAGKKYATMLQMLQYPLSVGSIHIPPKVSKTRTTVHDKPNINPKYYQGPGGEIDFQIMVAAQEFGHKITKTSPLSSIIVKRVFPPLPTSALKSRCDLHPTSNLATVPEDEDFSDYVRNYTITDWHPVGTCAMGPFPVLRLDENGKSGEGGDDLGGVVDARLRVHGVKRLRVVDASIMPLHISAHIQATVYAIGEKGARLILEDYESKITSNSAV